MKKVFIVLMLEALFCNFAYAQTDIDYEIVVAQDSSGDFVKIQDAVDAAKAFPDKRITIFVKNGVYHEKVRIPEWNNLLSLIGEDAEQTIIIWEDYFDKIDRGRNSTFFTWTLLVEADDFYAENLTVINAAGEVGQAVALHVEGNRCVFKNCRFLGNQDTVYLTGENGHHYFSGCKITGTTDFIFGSSTVFFSQCEIVSKANSYITAASTSKNKSFGFVFSECKLTADENVELVYLGRPWRMYAKTVFLNCELGKHIATEGWHDWNKPEAQITSFYAEFKNTGVGAITCSRVKWSHQLSDEEAKNYTPENVLGEWVTAFLEK